MKATSAGPKARLAANLEHDSRQLVQHADRSVNIFAVDEASAADQNQRAAILDSIQTPSDLMTSSRL